MVQEVRVGVLGAGALGGVHAANVAHIPGCRLTRVAGTSVSDRVAKVAGLTGAEVVPASRLIDPDLIDVLVIATPTDTHVDYARTAIQARISTFLEKPVTRTLLETEELIALAHLHDVKVAVGHVVRYFPEYAAARDIVVSLELGRPQTARLRRLNAMPGDRDSWFARPARSGGVLLDMAIHDIDWCLWTFGAVDRVYCRRAGDFDSEVTSITLLHRNGAIASIDASWREREFSTQLEVTGTDGLLEVGGSGSAGFTGFRLSQAPSSYLPTLIDTPSYDDPYLLELAAAIGWFRGGPPPLATLVEAAEAMRVVEAAATSAATGAPVRVAA